MNRLLALSALVLVLVLFPITAAAQNPEEAQAFFKILLHAVRDRNWTSAAAALLVLTVGLTRLYGAKIHDLIPDDTQNKALQFLDNLLGFLLESKPGGWVLNVLTAIAGACGTSLLAEEPITWELLKPTISVSMSGAGLWGAAKDMKEWMDKRKQKNQPEPASGS